MTGLDNSNIWLDAEAATRRFWLSIVVSATVMSVGGLVFGSAKITAGIVLGGVLALLNFRWLAGSVRAIMAVGSRRVPPGTAMKIALRWLVVGMAGYAGYRTGYFAAAGILIGLLAPVPAALFESVYLTFKTVGWRAL